MEKNSKKVNTLIKRNNLILELKERGISRASPDSLLLLEKYFRETLRKMAEILKEEITTQGRKTLKKEDVKVAIERIKREEELWEI